MTTLTYHEYENGRRRYTLHQDKAVLGWLHWREWLGGREGWQYIPNTTSRSRSRILRPELRDALIKAAKLPARTADELIANCERGKNGCGKENAKGDQHAF